MWRRTRLAKIEKGPDCHVNAHIISSISVQCDDNNWKKRYANVAPARLSSFPLTASRLEHAWKKRR